MSDRQAVNRKPRKGPVVLQDREAKDSQPGGEKPFSERLRGAMTEKGLTAAELARRVQAEIPQFSAGNISHYLAGRSVPRSRVLNTINQVLEGGSGERMPAENMSAMNGRAKPPRQEAAMTGPADLPALNLQDLGDGDVLLQINQKLPWRLAFRLLQTLKGDQPPD